MLLAVARVARTRFYTPPAMTAAAIRAADPVVTANDDRLRFESFSACAGAYARFDLMASSLDGQFMGYGTTNVDFNMPMRAALGRLGDADHVTLSVGLDELQLESAGERVVERKVPLPVRWVKGFAEVQLFCSRMVLVHELSAVEARRFLASISSARTGHAQLYAVRSGAGLRLSATPSPTAVHVGGVERLKALAELARWARSLRVYGEEGGSSGWELVLDQASFHLVISPDASRGFSGEGNVLNELVDPEAEAAMEQLYPHLLWRSRLDVAPLARATGLKEPAVRAGLGRLGASGAVGFDVAEGTYFHRELPFDQAGLVTMHPRLRDANRLVQNAAVRLLPTEGTETVRAAVLSGGVEHVVRITGADARCSCPWYGRHQGGRGPCKHVLATRLTMAAQHHPVPARDEHRNETSR